MASLIRVPTVPRCIHCLRQNSWPENAKSIPPFWQQIRGKKKVAKAPSTVNVKLLEDIKYFGRKGSIIRIAPGRMRNRWYPQRKASYVTDSRLKELGGVVVERDALFGLEEEVEKREEEQMVEVQMKLLPPARATEIIQAVIPPEVVFYRTSITTQDQDSSPGSRKIVQTPDIQTLLQGSAKPKTKPTMIYGSVSTADISESVKAILAQHKEGARAVLGSEDITILGEGGEGNGIEPGRIKALGTFTVDIRVKGGESIRRTIIVKAQEEDEAASQN